MPPLAFSLYFLHADYFRQFIDFHTPALAFHACFYADVFEMFLSIAGFHFAMPRCHYFHAYFSCCQLIHCRHAGCHYFSAVY